MLRLVRDPVLFKFDELSAALKHLKSIESGNAELQVRLVHSAEILIRAEHHYFIVHCAIRFRTFKALDRVVQSRICRVKFKSLIWNNLRSLPSTVLEIKIDFQHMIGLHGTESVHVIRTWLLFQLLSLEYLQIAGQESFLFSRKHHS